MRFMNEYPVPVETVNDYRFVSRLSMNKETVNTEMGDRLL